MQTNDAEQGEQRPNDKCATCCHVRASHYKGQPEAPLYFQCFDGPPPCTCEAFVEPHERGEQAVCTCPSSTSSFAGELDRTGPQHENDCPMYRLKGEQQDTDDYDNLPVFLTSMGLTQIEAKVAMNHIGMAVAKKVYALEARITELTGERERMIALALLDVHARDLMQRDIDKAEAQVEGLRAWMSDVRPFLVGVRGRDDLSDTAKEMLDGYLTRAAALTTEPEAHDEKPN